ncbi:hypothetical protein BRC88_09745 [Halobacteriales archaeon QS_4_69_225]|nr:MAG: hypothetical protein BRC88_09745 [Halobacteriales archaeon QS_4_69_225]
MAIQDVFLSPLGLAALLFAVPIVVLYLIRPDPDRVELPTFRFLASEKRQRATSPYLERLSRSLLLLLQLLAVVLVALSLAAPYVLVAERTTVEETVIVVDSSASMATTDGGESRFAAAVDAAEGAVTSTTSVVTTAGSGEVVARRATPATARDALSRVEPTGAPGDLRGAVTQATALAGENTRVVVFSDFAGDRWADPVTTARARGVTVDLRQFAGGGGANVGFIDREFAGSQVTLTAKNFGDEETTRTVTLGDQRREIRLAPGGVGEVTLSVPAGGGEARLEPGDDFAVDDTAAVAAPADETVDVLLFTNDRNRYLTAALEVIDQVNVTVAEPPTTVDREYDVVLYGDVEAESLLPGNVETGRQVLAGGGGVGVVAQPEPPERLGDLLLLEPAGTASTPRVESTTRTQLTADIDFQPPSVYLNGSLREGRALVELDDGTPLLATSERASGRLLYYGYIEDGSSFKFNSRYPVFWKRAAFYLADRPTLSSVNHATGETVEFDAETVEGPEGTLSGPMVTLREPGFYGTDGARESAALLSERESDTAVEPIDERDRTGNIARTAPSQVPRPLTEYFAVGALLVVVAEIGYLYRRGDL